MNNPFSEGVDADEAQADALWGSVMVWGRLSAAEGLGRQTLITNFGAYLGSRIAGMTSVGAARSGMASVTVVWRWRPTSTADALAESVEMLNTDFGS